jgi:hypothetical protein
VSEPPTIQKKRRRWPIHLLRVAAAFFIGLALVVVAHIVPECRTGRILLIADSNAPDTVIRVTLEYEPADRDFADRNILWEGPPPKSPSTLNYVLRGGATFNVYVRNPATGEWTRKDGAYLPATSGSRGVVIIRHDRVDLDDFYGPPSSAAWEIISYGYTFGSDVLSCVDVDKESLIARMEEQNRRR